MNIFEDLDRLRSASLVASPSAFARSSLICVQFAGHYFTNPGYSIERAHLDSYLLVCTLNGKGYLTYRGKTHTLGRGLGFLIDCREAHLYRTDPESLWEFAWVHLIGQMGQDLAAQFLKQGEPIFEDGDGRIADGIRQVRELQMNRDERSDLSSSALLVRMLTDVLLSAAGQRLNEPMPAWIDEIKTYLESRIQDGVRLDDLAGRFAVSKYHLSRAFKRHTGYSPYAYLMNLRMSAAKALLKTTDLSVEAIAYRAGFTNVTHFIQLFKNRERVTPLQFRKAWQGNPGRA
ncbi:AraC family transcriptional regulator [Cohnella nanjingensis]|uniref:AraC family transcriptional regulator n=1 Tax=Cohnella nanjingensis TaxID=1387779 RepID=A0A7X0VGQ7_9BACL|nr:AraC family transcriptional regulator [Cohnella nanjingensis]MBB6673106.1 AraC family transcriptional regulator [Cohnella nanjingensis]